MRSYNKLSLGRLPAALLTLRDVGMNLVTSGLIFLIWGVATIVAPVFFETCCGKDGCCVGRFFLPDAAAAAAAAAAPAAAAAAADVSTTSSLSASIAAAIGFLTSLGAAETTPVCGGATTEPN